MDYGFIRVGAAVPRLEVANCGFNADEIIRMINEGEAKGIQILAFPELAVTSYTCADLFHQQPLTREAEIQLKRIVASTEKLQIAVILGMPVSADNQLFNCAVVFQEGKILGVVPKTHIPNYSEFYEDRWFASATKAVSSIIELCGQRVPFGADLLFEAEGRTDVCFGVEICEDLWVPIPPSSYQALGGATLMFNLSASNELVGKAQYRTDLVKQQSARCLAGYVYVSSGIGESTTDMVFGGHAMIAENGVILAESQRFLPDAQLVVSEIDIEKLANDRRKNTSFMTAPGERMYRKMPFRLRQIEIERLSRKIHANPFIPVEGRVLDERCSEIFSIQCTGLMKRYTATGLKNAAINISGGLDSTLALLVTARTFDLLGLPRRNIVGITMPGFGTTKETHANAVELMESLGIKIREIDIKPACLQHFADIGHDPSVHDITYENVQARERTQVLMDIANKINGLAIGTGDLSELALGWCTYNGDHMSMYSVNSGVPKTLVKHVVRWAADNMFEESRDVLHRILNTPITPELLPPDKSGKISQKTEDIVGPYELHDFFLYYALRYGAGPRKILFLAEQAFEGKYERDVIKNWLRVFYSRFFSQQFKRSCLPDGPKVGTISLSPRSDWRMPSDASAALWLSELDEC